MKHFLLPLLLLPVSSLAQYNRSYTGPTMQQNMQSRQQFNQMTNQRTQDFQQRQLQRGMNGLSGSRMSRKEQQEAQAKQQKREQDANEKLTQLAQQLQRNREQHPAPNPQQAALQQKKDEKQLTLLAVKNYREVFLPGQLANVFQARDLPTESQRQLLNLNNTLADKAWWKKQESASLTGSLKAYGDTLTSLTTELLGFDLASPPALATAPSVNSLSAQLAAHSFDQKVATQLLREAALSEKLLAGAELAKAVVAFNALSAAVSPELSANPKLLKEEVETKLRQVNKAMNRYNARFRDLTLVSDTYLNLQKVTGSYVAKNGR